MVTGNLQMKNGKYYAVLNLKVDGKRKPKWIPLGLPVRGNKRQAEALLNRLIAEYESHGEGKFYPTLSEKGELVTAYGCDPITVDEEFMLQKRLYFQVTGRSRTDDVIAYQIRQSFKPGEIMPEEANRLGHELALRFTKGKYSFIVATHTDRAHIHNHIVCSPIRGRVNPLSKRQA